MHFHSLAVVNVPKQELSPGWDKQYEERLRKLEEIWDEYDVYDKNRD